MSTEERYAKWKAGKERKMERRRLKEVGESEGNKAEGVLGVVEGTAVAS